MTDLGNVDKIEGHAIGFVEVDESQELRLKLSDGDEEISVAGTKGPGRFVLVRTHLTPEAVSRTDQ